MIYCGITIGPIIETLCQASSPAALWYGSYLFSMITKKLCCQLLKGLGESIEIIAPYFNKDAASVFDGIGHYHDRIIFYANHHTSEIGTEYLAEKLQNIINDVKNEISEEILEAIEKDDCSEEIKQSIKDYFLIHFVIKEWNHEKDNMKDTNVITYINKQLDNLEMIQPIGVNRSLEYLYLLLNGDKKAANYYIKRSRSFREVIEGSKLEGIENENNIEEKRKQAANRFSLLNKAGRIKEVSEIASMGQYVESEDRIAKDDVKLKKYKYYAIVQADGDRVGALLGSLSNDEEVKGFSKECYDYTAEAAQLVKEYGGMPIYAGGDDLLFIAPVQSLNEERDTILKLCTAIDQCFKKKFEKYKEKGHNLSISFGISVNYRRFPLYEAFEEARKLLFCEAKKYRDSIGIKINKSSGQSVGLIIRNNCDVLKSFDKFISKYFDAEDGNKLSDHNTTLNSVLHRIEEFSALFKQAIYQDKVIQLFNNIFDDPEQEKADAYIKDVLQLTTAIATNQKDIIVIEDGKEKCTEQEKSTGKEEEKIKINKITSLLRIAKFFGEKVNEND